MRVWGKARLQPNNAPSVARNALLRVPRAALVREAVTMLLETGQVDRVGVWVETSNWYMGEPTGNFYGVLGEPGPAPILGSWSKLPASLHIPAEVLSGPRAVAHELAGGPREPLAKAMREMKRVLWMPVQTQGRVRGVIFAGQKKKTANLPTAMLGTVASELALALELEEERRRAGAYREINTLVRSVLESLSKGSSGAEPLNDIVTGCTRVAIGDTPAAIFAAIGRIASQPLGLRRAAGDSPANAAIEFVWRSGDAGWIQNLHEKPLRSLWRGALETGRTVGSEPPRIPGQAELGRIIAIPLRGNAELLGVFVAGIAEGERSLAILEAMELRAALAAAVLERATEPTHHREDVSVEHADAAHPAGDAASSELRNVIEWLEEGVVLLGANHEVRAINSRFAHIMGLTPAETKEIQTYAQLLSAITARMPSTSGLNDRLLHSAAGSEGLIRQQLQIERPVPRLVERTAHAILDKHGAPLGRVEIYRDHTAQSLFQAKLLHTRKLAELGQTLTTTAHELSNPLTSILGYAQRMLAPGEARAHSREARQILQQAERASAILRQLLLSARESRPERRRIALNQLVSRAVELQRDDLSRDNVKVELDLAPSLPAVKGDAGQLQQVLMNLIGNARQALTSCEGKRVIRIATGRITDTRVQVKVADNGPGIPASIQTHIFDPFFTTKPVGVGTGLGLSIVLAIVREHGGDVQVHSSPRQGSVFSVELPAMAALEMPFASEHKRSQQARQKQSHLPEQSPIPAQVGTALSRWAGQRVLVLEDEPTVANLIADVLEDEGLQVEMLLDSRQALSRATREPFALIICDMKMSGMDGEEFYQALARNESPRDATSLRQNFLFVTGDVLSAHTRNFLERHRLPYLAKPFRVEELTDKVRTVFEQIEPVTAAGNAIPQKSAARNRG